MRKKSLKQFVRAFADNASLLPPAAPMQIDQPVTSEQSFKALALKSLACRWGAVRFPLSLAEWCLHKANNDDRRAKAILLAMLVQWTTKDHSELTLESAHRWLPGQPNAAFWFTLEALFGDLSHFAGKITINDFNFTSDALDMPVEYGLGSLLLD